jgi:integrase
VLGRLLRLAARRGWIAHNPLQDVTMPRTRQRPFEAMTMERIRELIAVMRATPWRFAERDADIVTLFALTGLRRAEVARLTRADVDLSLSRVWVRGKTGDAYVPVTPELRPVLERLIVRSGKGPVLVGSADMLERVFARWKTQLDEPRLKPHVLRHSYATALVRAGVGIHLVRDLMRHASLQMTSRYLHSLGPEKHAAASLVSLRPQRAAGSSGEAQPGQESPDAQQAN